MKKLALSLLLVLALTFSLAACGGGSDAPATTPDAPDAGDNADAGDDAPDSDAPAGEVVGLDGPIADTPVLLTSVGQSADVEMVKVLMEKAEIELVMEKLATPADLDGIETLVLAVGGSSKGLGAAGIDANQELDRVKELIDAAKDKDITIITLHVGGEARRGDLSDKFIGPSFEKADYAVVVADGDKDGLMAGLAVQYGVPMDVVDGIADAAAPLQAAFK